MLRARLSGEIREYRKVAHDSGFCPSDASDREWFEKIKRHMIRKAYENFVIFDEMHACRLDDLYFVHPKDHGKTATNINEIETLDCFSAICDTSRRTEKNSHTIFKRRGSPGGTQPSGKVFKRCIYN